MEKINKIIIILIILIIAFQQVSFAAYDYEDEINAISSQSNVTIDIPTTPTNTGQEVTNEILTGAARLIYYPLKFIIFIIPSTVIQLIIEGIANIDGWSKRCCNIR